MKQVLLAASLIAAPVAAFTTFNLYMLPAAVNAQAAPAALGDLTAMQFIVSDVQKIAGTGDLAAAEVRIKDFETAWDEAESKLKPLNKAAWHNVDDAADEVLSALRESAPDAIQVATTLTALTAALVNPDSGASSAPASGPKLVQGIAVTDEVGGNIACEEMLKSVAAMLATATPSDADKASIGDFQAKAMERCNADDDQHADEFSAQALALMSK
jgi:hypothetical protein